MIKSKNKIIPIILFFISLLSPLHSQNQVDSLKNLIDKSEGKQKLKLLVEIGYFLSSENPNEAIKYLEEAISLADNINSRWSKADAIFNKGVALWHLGEITQSDKLYEEAIKIYEEFNDSLSLIKVFNSQAINHQMKGSVDLAFETFLRSLDYAKKIGDNSTILNTLLNIGVMYDNNGDYENCLKYYLEGLKYAENSDKATLALLQSYIAEVYLSQKNIENAEKYLEQAIQNSRAANDSKSLIWAYSILGNIQLDKNNYQAAERYFTESLQLARNIDYKLEIIHALSDLGKYYNRINNFSQAEKSLSEAFNLAKELNSLTDLSIIYEEFSELYSKNQNFKKAFEFHQKYKEISDSLFVLSNSEKITELKTKQELKQKDRETELLIHENDLQKKIINSQKIIALVISLLAIGSIIFIWVLLRNRNKILKAKNLLQFKNDEIENNRTEISEKNEVLAGLNATKDKFFSIIAHDLRNPIAAFVNISELLELDYDKISDNDKREIISQMNSSSKNLIRLLENLLTWARLSNNKIDVYPENLLMKDVLESSIHPYLQSAQNKKIKIIVDIPDELTIETDRFIIQTIIGNLINNAIKFSNQHSEINISLTSTKHAHKLAIKDNGIGIEESQLRNIFVLGKISTGRGTMGEGGTGLGLVLVKELVEILNWQIEVKSKVNAGSEFVITIPIQE
jgi:signal transduction histidine kinase/Flp pilus assembly protein TadD